MKTGPALPVRPCRWWPWIIAASLAASPCSAASLILDSFDQGPFQLTLSDPENNSVIDSPLAQARFSSLSPRQAEPGAVMVSTLTTDTGQLSFYSHGISNAPNIPLHLHLTYGQGGPYSIAGYSGFVFQFNQIIGTGSLIVELGSGSGLYGPATHRLALSDAGEVFYSLADLNFSSGGSIASFSAMQIRFEANTPEFSFTLDEIRLVPEPSTLPVILSAGACLLHRRRRGRETVG